MNFDWQTEETTAWDEPVTEPMPPGKRPFRRWLGLIVGLVALAALLLLAWAWQQRVATVTTQVDGDVLASHAILREAAIQQDGELIISVLSGRDETWAAQMAGLAASGQLVARPEMALTWLPETAVISPTVSTAPDFRAAEVVWTETYAIDVGHGLTEMVTLAHTAVYRQGGNRWLLTPPDGDFWGEEQVLSGQYLALAYPGRDAALVGRLLLNLDALLGRMCGSQLPGFTCPTGWQLPVRLVTSPEALAGNGRAEEEGVLRLPTPTLMGLPTNEAAYQALYRGYAGLIVAEALDSVNPASGPTLAQALVRLGLRPESAASTTAPPTSEAPHGPED